MMTVSVIIPVFNASRTLDGCLGAVGGLDPAPDQIILVDNGSTDGSYERLLDFAKDRPQMVVLQEKRRGPGLARNAGIGIAKGEVLAFLDSDCVADPGWLGALLPAFRDPKVGAVAGRLASTSPRTTVELFNSLFTLQTPKEPVRYTAWTPAGGGFSTSNLAVRRRLAVELGGFCETWIPGEDHDLCARVYAAGYAIQYVPEGVVLHQHRTSLRATLQQAFLFGQGHPLLVRRHLPGALWVDLPGRSVLLKGSPVPTWLDLVAADKKGAAILVAGMMFHPVLWLLPLYAAWLATAAGRRAHRAGVHVSPLTALELAGLLLAKSAAMTAGRWWGSVRYGALCF